MRFSLVEDRVYGYTINDNRASDDRDKGSAFWHGRFYLHIYRYTFSWQWGFANFARLCMLSISKSADERSIRFAFCIPYLFSLFFSVEGLPFIHYTNLKNSERDLSIRVFDWRVWFTFWGDPSGWGPRRELVISPLDILFGKEKYSRHEIDLTPMPMVVEMPERSYRGTAQRFISTRKRPRWKANSLYLVKIEMEEPIPVPGKGENSWDLDDDAIFGISCHAETVEEAIERVRESAFSTRKKYGWSCQE